MKNYWQEVKLGDICEYSRNRISISEVNLCNYVSTENLLKERAGKTIADSIPEQANLCEYNKGCTLISNIRPYFKKIWFANTRGGCSNDVLVYKPNNGINDKWLYYLLSQDSFFNFVMSGTKGTKMPRGDKSQIMKFPVALPPLDEQKKIAGVLSAFDDKIELNNKINRNLEAQAQAIFKSWFIDFEPFKNSKFIDSELGKIPEGWDIGTIGDISIISTGKRPDKKSVNKSNETPIPIIGASSIMGYTNKVLYDEKILITGRVGTHGIIQKIDSPCWPSDNTLVLRSKNLNFLHNCLLLINWKSMNRGSTQPLITQNDLKNIRIILPQDGIIQNYEQLVHYFDIKFHNNNKEIYSLSQIRDLLLPKLMSGEVNISD